MILSNKQCKALLSGLYEGKITEKQQRLAVRNLTMALFMLDIGLRTTEVVCLIKSELIKAGIISDTLLVRRGVPAGHRGRHCELTDKIKYFIGLMDQLWWSVDSDKPGNFAFYDKSPVKHITATQFRRIINKAGISALGYSIRPNILRRTCAARLLKKTDLETIQNLLDYKTDQESFYC